ncbi:MAG: hypothetical protein DSZ28_05605 [Thiothrix sp.]|nr:MAG: hypothetical protein DSZ28_05605 [Thiothrix sp.]
MNACSHSDSNEPTNTLGDSAAVDNPQNSTDSGGLPSVGTEVSVDTLVFPHPAMKQQFQKFQDCFSAHTDEEDWFHKPLSIAPGARHVHEQWCQGMDATPDCNTALSATELLQPHLITNPELLAHRDKQLYSLVTPINTKLDHDWPEVESFIAGALKSPSVTQGDWGIRLAYEFDLASGGPRPLHYLITFPRFDGDTIAEEFKLRSFYSYTLFPGTEFGGSTHSIAPPGVDDELSLLLASPASLYDTLITRYDALLSEVKRAIDSGEAFKYEHKGNKDMLRAIPPEEVPLTPEEGRIELEKAHTRIGKIKLMIEQNALTFHQLLTEVIGQCGW